MRHLALSMLLPLASAAFAQDSLAERVPSLEDTAAIEVSSTGSDSDAYLTVQPSGILIFEPFRASLLETGGRAMTSGPVVSFPDVYRQIANIVVMEETSPDDRLVYFVRRDAGSSTAVFIPHDKRAVADGLFETFAKAEKQTANLAAKE